MLGGLTLLTILATSARAAVAPISPATSSSTRETHPTFTWTVQPPDVATLVSIARAAEVGANGEFLTANLVDVESLDAGATSWSPTRPLVAGTYWWHIGWRDTTPNTPSATEFTPARQLTILPWVSVSAVKYTRSGHEFLVSLLFKADVPSVHVLVKLYQGKRLLGTHSDTTNNFLIDPPSTEQSDWTLPSTTKPGTGLRLVFTLAIPGTTTRQTLTKTIRAH